MVLAEPAEAQSFPDRAERRVNDLADLLDPAAEAELTRQLDALNVDLGTDMTVLTITSRADYGDSPSIETFATALFNDWGIGSADNNSGILVLVARQDREMRIELGADYPVIYDQIAENVIDGAFLPAFRRNDYQNGILRGVNRTIDRIAVPFANGEAVRVEPDPESVLQRPSVWAIVLGNFAVMGGIATWWVRRRRKCPQCGQQTLRRSKEILVPASRTSTGQGRREAKCTNCDFAETGFYTVPMISSLSSSSSSGGGFSSGGGSSSGGGASGRW